MRCEESKQKVTVNTLFDLIFKSNFQQNGVSWENWVGFPFIENILASIYIYIY